MKSIKNFLKSMLSENGSISSKRVVGFGSFLLVALCVIRAVMSKPVIVPEFIWFGVLGLIGACFGLNAFLQSQSTSVKKKVALDQDTAEEAKEILNNTNP